MDGRETIRTLRLALAHVMGARSANEARQVAYEALKETEGFAFHPFPPGFPVSIEQMREQIRIWVTQPDSKATAPVTWKFWTEVITRVDAGEPWAVARLEVADEMREEIEASPEGAP